VVSLGFSVTYFLPTVPWPWLDSAPSENEYQEHFLGGKGGRCVGLTTSPPSRAECHEICEPKPPGTLWATPGLLRDFFTFTFIIYFTAQHRKLRFYAYGDRIFYVICVLNHRTHTHTHKMCTSTLQPVDKACTAILL
jgi:hypothetical protein